MKTRILSMSLVIAFVVSLLSCSGQSADGGKDAPSQSTDSPVNGAITSGIEYVDDELPELDFGGANVTILSSNVYSDEGEVDRKPDFTIEELSSEAINDSLYNRERYVEERLKVEINNPQTVDYMVIDEMRKNATSGDDVYDAYLAAVCGVSSFVFEEYLVDLYDMEYLDFDKPWWSEKFNREAEFLDSLYMTTGSLSLTPIRYSYAVYYNKSLAKRYENSIEDLGNLYNIVDSGKWTFDKFAEISGEVYEDVNGNSERDLEDIYGIACALGYPIDAIWSSFDIDVFNKTSDGWYEFDVNTDKLYTALDKINNLLHYSVGSITAGVGRNYRGNYVRL